MTVQFLGTGAAEGVPPLFSRTEHAERIRREGGHDLRSRSALRLGDEHQIDFGPDHFYQALRCGCDYYDLAHVLVTHTHSDHIQLDGILAKEMPAGTNGAGVALYASPAGADWIERLFELAVEPHLAADRCRRLRERYPVTKLDYFGEYDVGGLSVQTVRGNHVVATTGEHSINPLITLPSGARLLYAVDTGYYEEESWEFLAGAGLDALIMESTFGGRTDRDERPFGHLDCRSFLLVLERMAQEGVIHEGTAIYATHINPDQGLDHARLQQWYDESEFTVTVATDCLSFEL